MTSHPTFARVLGRADLLLFTVAAILTIDTLASAASMGVTWFAWWTITMVVFFVPYGLMTAEMGAAWPGEGGLYIWVREGLGPRWDSLAAWFYWINNAYWIPSVYMVFAGTFQTIFLKGRLPAELEGGNGATWLQAGIAILLTWLTVGIGSCASRWRSGCPTWAPWSRCRSSSASARSASVLASFNMIPIPRLDGGRVLTGLLPTKQALLFDKIEPFGFNHCSGPDLYRHCQPFHYACH